ncbi:hypothetical protein M9458_050706, partial [Cirrhinus mrigala]
MSTESPATTNPFSELVNALKAAFQQPSTPPSVSGSPMAMPATFAGEAVECSGFLLQVNLFIKMQPQLFTSEDAKVAFLISLLTSKALLWAKAIWNADNPIIHSYEQFTNHFTEVFSTTTEELATSDQLFRLHQGTSSVNHYTLHFRTLAAASGWNEKALLGAYRQGLNPDLRAAMALYDDSIGLEAFLQRTTKVTQNLAACQPPITAPQPASVAACHPVPEPMQIDSARLSRAERNRRIMNGLCLYCGQPGHHLRQCSIRPPRPVVSTLSTQVEITSLTLLPVTLHTSNISLQLHLSRLSESTSTGSSTPSSSYISENHPRKTTGAWEIRHSSPIITLQVGLFHYEDIKFLVLEDSTASIILGRPWLQQHHTAPLLHHPDPELPFTVEPVRVLSQAVGEPPLLHPCAFFSRKLSPAEQNYDVGNRELLAIKLALDEWCHWLEGSKHPFTIITDHKNLQYIREAKRLNPRQARWALFFTRFDYKITYRPGSKNISADTLSRLHSTEQPVEPEPIVPSNLIISPIVWELDEDIRSATLQEAAPPECPEGKIFVPLALRQNLLDTAHRSPGSGHPGSQRTLSLLQSRYWWPSMRRDTIRYVQSCSVCAMSTSPRQLPTGKLVPLPIPQRPWSHIGVDFVTNLPAAEGNTCILVMVDRFSKMCKFFPLKGLPTAMETAETLFQHLFRHFGLPEEIVSDRGPQFISHVWKAFFKLLGATVNLSSGYHPQTNGQTERKIQELGRYLWAYCHTDQHCWSRFLPWAKYAQNSLRQYTTGLTPFLCVLGYQPPLFPWTEEPSNVPAVDHWFRESERVWDSAHHHLQRAVRQNRFADVRRRPAPEFQPGDQVWLSTRDLRLRQPCRKLSPRYIGPFKILRRINDVTFQLQLPPRYRIHPTFHVSLLKPCYPSATEQPGAEVEPPPPEILEPPSIYTVHEILSSRRRGGRLEYLVNWEGYGPEERSWVSRD